MKKIFILTLIFLSTTIYSQDFLDSYEYGTIFFRNGKTLRGHLKMTSNNDIKYKLLLGDKKQVFDDKTVNKIIFDEDKREFIYKIKDKSVLLLERRIKGKLDLFYTEVITSDGFGNELHYTIYYIGKTDYDLVMFLPKNTKSKKFIKIISKYTSDCKIFTEAIKDKKSILENFDYKNTRVIDMITYYNSHCK